MGQKLGLLWVRLGSFWVCFSSGRRACFFVNHCQIKGFESAGGGQDWVRFARKGRICRGSSTEIEVPYRHVGNWILGPRCSDISG
jgi:hypothetical protein